MKVFMLLSRLSKIAVALAACTAPVASSTPVRADAVLNVANWTDYIDQKALEEFTKETGIRVVYDTYDSNEILETRLLAGNTGYDIVVPSATFLQRQIKAGVFQKLNKTLLPNLKGISADIAARLPADARQTTRHDLGLADDEPCLLMAARIVPAKGHDTALRALARLREQRWTLLLAGDHHGDLGPQMQALARELGIAERVRFLGLREDVPALVSDWLALDANREAARLAAQDGAPRPAFV